MNKKSTITLNDAFERARLASDESGLLSQQTYNMICAQLSDAEKYAFTLGLVDLGIQTKRGSEKSTRIVARVLGKKLKKSEKVDLYDEKHWQDLDK